MKAVTNWVDRTVLQDDAIEGPFYRHSIGSIRDAHVFCIFACKRITSFQMVRRFTWSLLIVLVAVQAMAGTCSLRCGMSSLRGGQGNRVQPYMAHCHTMVSAPVNSTHTTLRPSQKCSGLPCHYSATIFRNSAAVNRAHLELHNMATVEIAGFHLAPIPQSSPPRSATGLRVESQSPLDPLLASFRV